MHIKISIYADCLCISFSIRNLYHKQILLLHAESMATPENRLQSLPTLSLSHRKDTPISSSSSPPFYISNSWANLLDSLSCLHFFRARDKRPTRSKMRAMIPMEPETAVAAVPKLRKANKREEDTPAVLFSSGGDHPQNCPRPPLSCRISPTSGLPSAASILSLFSLPQSPWPWDHSHQAKKTLSPKSSILLCRASPSLTHLLRSSGVVSGIRVVMFSAKRDREEKRRRFESNFYTQALY